jgi:hypothetical protein
MNQLFLIMAIILILIAIYIYVIKSSKVGKQRALRQDIRRQLRLPPKLADETIERHIIRLKKRHPNRSEEWYLEKIIYDLERDRG